MNKKLTSLALALAIVGSSISPAIASEENKKEEVVYINTKENGDVDKMNVVNIFSKGNVVDYGDYDEVKLLNSNKKIENNKGEIKFEADKERTYYQGELKNNQSPWDIVIKYYLNDKEIDAKDIKGKNGKIKIRIKISKNTSVKNDYFDNYALQVNTKLDTEKIENINAEGATLANEGSNKLITYTALAGKGLDKEITFDAKDFSYPGFSINAVKISLDVDIDKGDIDSKINELIDATKQLNDGSNDLNNKSDDLKSASSALNDGMENLSRGNADFSKGVDTLYKSISTVQNGLTSLNNKSESLVNGSNEVQNALNEIEKSLNNMPTDSDRTGELSKASSDIRDGIKTLDESLSLAIDATNPKSYQNTLKSKGLDQEKLRASNDQAIGEIDETIKLLKQQLALAELNNTSENKENNQNKENNTKNIPSENPNSGNNKEQSPQKDENKDTDKAKEKTPGENDDNIKSNDDNNKESENKKTKAITAIKTSNQNADMIRQQIYMLENTKKLLQANNANIDGTNVYLKGVNDSFSQIKNGANILNTNYEKFDKEIQNISSKLTELKIQSQRLSDAIRKLNANYKLLNQGIISYTSSLAKIERGNMQILKGVEDLSTANSKLVKGSNDLKDGTNKLNEGINQYTNGVGKLNNGINEFYNETSDMDKDLNKKIDEIKKSLGDKNTPTKSFSSDKNGEIKSLQFVIQTEKIEKEEEKTESIKEKKEDKNFIEKFKDLFK